LDRDCAGLDALKAKAERIGGRFTFDRLREREGLGGKNAHGGDVLNKSRVSRLLAIFDNLPAVEKWRAGLSPKQQFEWASPEAVHQHCPVFAAPLDEEGTRKPSPYAQMKQANIALHEENARLKQRDDGDTFNPKTSSPREIALALVGQLAPYRGKAEKVWHELGALVKPKKATAEPTGA
jgi:hypothetical protein